MSLSFSIITNQFISKCYVLTGMITGLNLCEFHPNPSSNYIYSRVLQCISSHIKSSATTRFAQNGNRRMWWRFVFHTSAIFNMSFFWDVNYFKALILHVLGETDWNNLAICFDSLTAEGCWCLNTGTWIRGRCWHQSLGGVFLVLFIDFSRELGCSAIIILSKVTTLARVRALMLLSEMSIYCKNLGPP
jgi:hypothetical protein